MATDRVKIERWGPVSKRPADGHLGARARVKVEREDGWEARYDLDSHGKNPAAVADALDALEAHHDAWAARLIECTVAHGTEFTIGEDVYRVVDFTIPVYQPGRRPRVVVGVKRVVGPKLVKVQGFPLVLAYETLLDIPANAAIIAEVRGRLEARAAEVDADRDFKERVGQVLAARGRD